jgi:hypothetical protein
MKPVFELWFSTYKIWLILEIKILLNYYIQCCGAGAAGSRIIVLEPETEPQRDAAQAPNLMFTMDYQNRHKLH